MTKKSKEEDEKDVDEGKQEEMHCTKCGTYLGQYRPGSYGTIPCPRCKEPNVMDYTGEELVVKRQKRAGR